MVYVINCYVLNWREYLNYMIWAWNGYVLFDIDVVNDVDMWFVQWMCLSIVLELLVEYIDVIGAMDMFDACY